MPARPRAAVGALLLLGWFMPGCKPRVMNVGHPQYRDPPPCPSFKVASTGFDITTAADSAVLGPGKAKPASRVKWDANAVTSTQHFNVSVLTDANGDTIPGVRVGGPAGLVFEEPVQLRLSYSACYNPGAGKRPYVLTRQSPSDPWQRVNGSVSKGGMYVEVYVEHFSDYAIAE